MRAIGLGTESIRAEILDLQQAVQMTIRRQAASVGGQ
jgi:hypothetical protein